MIIGYRESFPRRHKKAGKPTDFKSKILDGTKRHTLRAYSSAKCDRWKKAAFIHHAVRNRTSEQEVFRVQENPKNVQVVRLKLNELGWIDVYVLEEHNGQWRKLNVAQREAFINNDGFETEEEFVEWFEYDVKKGMDEYVLVHFYPNFRY